LAWCDDWIDACCCMYILLSCRTLRLCHNYLLKEIQIPYFLLRFISLFIWFSFFGSFIVILPFFIHSFSLTLTKERERPCVDWQAKETIVPYLFGYDVSLWWGNEWTWFHSCGSALAVQYFFHLLLSLSLSENIHTERFRWSSPITPNTYTIITYQLILSLSLSLSLIEICSTWTTRSYRFVN
jgi:hypothetical protein